MDNELKTKGTYKVHEDRIGWLKEKLAKLNRKAVKLSVPEVTFRIVGEELVPLKDGDDLPTGEAIRYFLVDVDGTAPRIEGWTFVATLQHADEAGTVIRTVPGYQDQVPVKYRTASRFDCDHCRASRNRKDTYLVRSDEGEWKQVGANCLADFLGGMDPHRVAQWAQLSFSIDETFRAGEGYQGINDPRIYLESWLAQVAKAVRVDGRFISRKAADAYNEKAALDGGKGIDSTSSKARSAMFARTEQEKDAWAAYRHPEAQDEAFAEQALVWVRETFHAKDFASRTDFEHNLVVATSGETIQTRSMNLAAAAVGMYFRHLGMEAERKARSEAGKASVHFGTVGERLVFWAKPLAAPKTFDSQFGTTYLYKLITREGNMVTWFGSRRVDELEFKAEGNEFLALIGTVKKHDTFREEKQTTVSRVSLATQKQIDKATGAVKAKKEQAAAEAAVLTRFDQLNTEDW